MLPLSSAPQGSWKLGLGLGLEDLGRMEDEERTEDAPRMTQLSRVDPNSAFHFRRTPSSTPSSPAGSSILSRRISLKFFKTSAGEWWEISDDLEEEGEEERDEGEDLRLEATAAEGARI